MWMAPLILVERQDGDNQGDHRNKKGGWPAGGGGIGGKSSEPLSDFATQHSPNRDSFPDISVY